MLRATAVAPAAVAAGLLLTAIASPASAAILFVHANAEAVGDILDYVEDPLGWTPALDGHVYVSADGMVYVQGDVLAGDSPVPTPIEFEGGAGGRCVKAGPWYVYLYLRSCLER